MTINKSLTVSLGLLLSTAAFAADDSAPIIIDASPCMAITRSIERLSCFEDQARAAQQQPAVSTPQQNLPVVSVPSNTAPKPAQPTPETPQTEKTVDTASVNTADSFEDNFGLPDEKRSDWQEKKDKDEELIARVAGIKELNSKRKVITLENGQVWEQMETKRFALADGDEIRIYPTRWGNSYRLASQTHNGFIQVRRLR